MQIRGQKSSSPRKFPIVLVLVVFTGVIVALNLTYLSKSIVRTSPDQALENGPASSKKQFLGNSQSRLQKAATGSTLRESDESGKTVDDGRHEVAGLNCDKYGGPSQDIASEMVYWQDIPTDAGFVSPFAKYGKEEKYLTFEPDEGGWNNIRMSMETATVLAHAMGRTLVLPPEQEMYLLWNDKKKKKNNRFTFRDFFHFDSIAEEHPAVNVISMEEFLQREVFTGKLVDKETGQVAFPPGNATTWDGNGRKGRQYWLWFRKAVATPIWNFDKCIAAFASHPGPKHLKTFKTMVSKIRKGQQWQFQQFIDNPVPVDSSPIMRLREQLGDRRNVCFYGDALQNEKVVHFMGDNDSGARLLVHFYAFLFFENYHQDLWTKRFVRDHLRYIDEIQCAAARVVHAMRQKVIENGDPTGVYDSFHIRRGDFQYKQTRISAQEIYENIKDVLIENSTIFVATDEKDMNFFNPLREHYNLYFLKDFKHLIKDVNVNYMGMLDQRIASRGRTFVGSYFSTFTGYINRMRGYHSQMDKLPGYEKGEINSFYYVPTRNKLHMRRYVPIHSPMWAREFPIGWRDIDRDLSSDALQVTTND